MKLALIGYGKMGKEIEQIAIDRGHTIELIIDIDNQHDLTVENLKKCDAARQEFRSSVERPDGFTKKRKFSKNAVKWMEPFSMQATFP